MRIEHNFLEEFVIRSRRYKSFDLDSAIKACFSRNDPEPADLFLQHVAEAREKEFREKRAKGLCISVSEYESLSAQMLDLARFFHMDYVSEIKEDCAFLTLTGHDFTLSIDEHPEACQAMSQLIARADRLFIDPLVKYDEPAIELHMIFILSK